MRWQVTGRRDGNQVADGRPLMRNPFGYIEGHGNAPVVSDRAAGDVLVPRGGQEIRHGWPRQVCWRCG